MKTMIKRLALRRTCVRIGAIAILSLGSFVFGSPAAEVPSSMVSMMRRDASNVLEETELRVLTQHYEKTLAAFYDAQLELRLRQDMPRPGGLTAEARHAAEVELNGLSMRVKILAEWTERIRVQIEDKVQRINVRLDKARVEQLRTTPFANEPVGTPAKPSAPGSPSSSAPEPKRQPEL